MMEWWTSQQSGLYGGIGGSVIGVLGGLTGVTLGFLAPRGVGRALVIPSLFLIALAGGILLGVGVFAVLAGQPYHVYYPLVLGGGLTAGIWSAMIPIARQAYRRAEQNRLSAEELRRT